LIAINYQRFKHITIRQEKIDFIWSLYDQIREAGGRFLAMDGQVETHFTQASEGTAQIKISQALRRKRGVLTMANLNELLTRLESRPNRNAVYKMINTRLLQMNLKVGSYKSFSTPDEFCNFDLLHDVEGILVSAAIAAWQDCTPQQQNESPHEEAPSTTTRIRRVMPHQDARAHVTLPSSLPARQFSNIIAEQKDSSCWDKLAGGARSDDGGGFPTLLRPPFLMLPPPKQEARQPTQLAFHVPSCSKTATAAALSLRINVPSRATEEKNNTFTTN
jgi:hypothetical protein